MCLAVQGDPGTAAAAVYDRPVSARARAYTTTHAHKQTHSSAALKMEPEQQNTILSDLPPRDISKIISFSEGCNCRLAPKLHNNQRFSSTCRNMASIKHYAERG